MPLDGITTDFLCRELSEELIGSRINRIFQPAAYDLSLHLWQSGRQEQLFLSANPSAPRAYLRRKAGPNPKLAPAFCMLLRKLLTGGEIIGLEHEESERVFSLLIQVRNEYGDLCEKRLVAELTGRHSNLILLSEDKIIHDAIRHIDHSVNRLRELMPARPYLEPPRQNKHSVSRVLAQGQRELENGKIPSFLLDGSTDKSLYHLFMDTLGGFSPLLVRELLFRAGLPEEMTFAELKADNEKVLATALGTLLTQCAACEARPSLYASRPGDTSVYDFHALPLTLLPRLKECTSISAAMDEFYEARERKLRFMEQKKAAEKRLSRIRKQNSRKLSLHEEDLREGEKAGQYRLYGELLQASLYAFKGRTDRPSHVSVKNYYDPDGKELLIPLDPSLNLPGNVERFFKHYRKAEEKRRHAENFLRKDRAEEAWIESLAVALERAENPEDIQAVEDEIRHELRPEGMAEQRSEKAERPLKDRLNPGRPSSRKKKKARNTLPEKKQKQAEVSSVSHNFRAYFSQNGLLIRSGRNNLENEQLSLRKSHQNDLWFHAHNIPGSHVVLHLDGREADELSIEDAASVAAWFSSANRANSGGKVEIDYCPVKNLSKARGAKPGHLIYKNFKTIYVEARNPHDFLRPAEEGKEKA